MGKTDLPMKRLLSTLIVAMTISFAYTANAQMFFGVKGGVNVTKVTLDKNLLSSDNHTGFFVGLTGGFNIPAFGLGLEASVLYDNKGTVISVDDMFDEYDTKHLNYIDLPVNARFTIGLGSVANLFFTTGPQFSYNIGNKSIKYSQFKFKDSEFSWNVGGGLRLMKHFQLSYNYNIGFGKTTEAVDASAVIGDVFNTLTGKGVKNNTHQVAFAYLF